MSTNGPSGEFAVAMPRHMPCLSSLSACRALPRNRGCSGRLRAGHVRRPEVLSLRCPVRPLRKRVAEHVPVNEVGRARELDVDPMAVSLGLGRIAVIIAVGRADDRRIGEVRIENRIGIGRRASRTRRGRNMREADSSAATDQQVTCASQLHHKLSVERCGSAKSAAIGGRSERGGAGVGSRIVIRRFCSARQPALLSRAAPPTRPSCRSSRENFPDAFVLPHGSEFIAYSTNDGPNVPVAVSRDLVHWSFVGDPATDKQRDALPQLGTLGEGRASPGRRRCFSSATSICFITPRATVGRTRSASAWQWRRTRLALRRQQSRADRLPDRAWRKHRRRCVPGCGRQALSLLQE